MYVYSSTIVNDVMGSRSTNFKSANIAQPGFSQRSVSILMHMHTVVQVWMREFNSRKGRCIEKYYHSKNFFKDRDSFVQCELEGGCGNNLKE